MTKGDLTRTKILQLAAPLFNQRGYSGVSFGDIMAATGMGKGGITNHFGSKDALALAAFDYAFELASRYFLDAVASHTSTRAKLHAVLDIFHAFTQDHPLPGGCPILNTAVDSDDTHADLRQRAQAGMAQWRGFIAGIVRKGMQAGELRPGLDPQRVATVMIAALEGGVMLSRLYGDTTYMNHIIEHLTGYLEREVFL
jgi:TetR/AcrR family transcriptional regulator, transcriptional repressor for nem operon